MIFGVGVPWSVDECSVIAALSMPVGSRVEPSLHLFLPLACRLASTGAEADARRRHTYPPSPGILPNPTLDCRARRIAHLDEAVAHGVVQGHHSIARIHDLKLKMLGTARLQSQNPKLPTRNSSQVQPAGRWCRCFLGRAGDLHATAACNHILALSCLAHGLAR